MISHSITCTVAHLYVCIELVLPLAITFYSYHLPFPHCKLQVAKRQSVPSVAPPTSDLNHAPQPTSQQATVTSNSFEKSRAETFEEISALEDGQFSSSFLSYALQ